MKKLDTLKSLDYFDSAIDGYSLATSLLLAATANKRKLTPEEVEARKIKIEKDREENRRIRYIRNCICPSCEGKLIRGKKDKKMNYQRGWECKSCDEVHYI